MIRLLTLATLTTTLLACSPSDYPPGPYVNPPAYADGGAEVTGRLMGEMPTVGPFEEVNTYGYAKISTRDANMEIHAFGDYGWAMLNLRTHFDDKGELVDEHNIIGCTGRFQDVAQYDAHSIDAEVVFDVIKIDGEDHYQFEIEAEFDEGTLSAVVHVPVEYE